MRLLQSIFGGRETRGRYPETLIAAAIERAVDGTDPRLRLLPGYRKALREPVIQAADQIVALVDGLPACINAGYADHGNDARLGAVFASARSMHELFSRDAALTAYLSSPEGRGAGQLTALLLAERDERNILGMELVGDQVQREVAQIAVSFSGHRLLEPTASEEETRRQLKRRAFDHLLTLALGRIAEARVERADLARQRDLLRRRLAAFEHGGWSLEATDAAPEDRVALEADLDAVTAQLDALGADSELLHAHLEMVADLLRNAGTQLWAEGVVLSLDAMNIRRNEHDPTARRIDLVELHSGSGRRAVLLPLAIPVAELPPREDLVTAAQRYLY